MSNTMFKLTRKPRRKVKEEKEAIALQQQKLRTEIEELEAELNELMEKESKAIADNDSVEIARLGAKIEGIEKKIARNEKRHKDNVDILKSYTDTINAEPTKTSNTAKTIVDIVVKLGGLAIGSVGLYKAYESDEAGTLVRKKTIDWIKNLPIIRDIGRQ